MKWEVVDGELIQEEFLQEDDRVKNLDHVEIIFDDGEPTAIVVGLLTGNSIVFHSSETSGDGCHKELVVKVETQRKGPSNV